MDEDSEALEAYERELYELDNSSDGEEDDTKEVEEMLYRNIHYAPCLEGELPLSKPQENEVNDINDKGEKSKKFLKRYYDTEDLSAMKCYNCEEVGHRATDCPNEKKIVCYKCNGTGHLSRDCPNIVCFTCNEPGHFSRDCKMRKCHSCNDVGHIAKYCTFKRSQAINGKTSKDMLNKFGDYCKDVCDKVKDSLQSKESQNDVRDIGNLEAGENKDQKNKLKSKNLRNKRCLNVRKNKEETVSNLLDDAGKSKSSKVLIDKPFSNLDTPHSNGDNSSIIEVESNSVSTFSNKVLKKKIRSEKKETIDLVSEDSDSCQEVNELRSYGIESDSKRTNQDNYSPFSDLFMDKSRKITKDEHTSIFNTSKNTYQKRLKPNPKVFDHQSTLNDLRNILCDSADEDSSDQNFQSDDLPNINVNNSDSDDGGENDIISQVSDGEGGLIKLDFMNFEADATHYDPTEVDIEHLNAYGLWTSNSTSANNSSRLQIKGKDSSSFRTYCNSPGIKKDDKKEKKAKKIYLTKMKKHFKNAKTNTQFRNSISSTKCKLSKKKNVVHRNNDFIFRNIKKNVIVLD